ncbi:hypothetical protein D3C75_766710 [compost metagenome]
MRATDLMLDLGRPVAYYPKLAKRVGGVNACLLFCQLLYWTDKEQSELGIYKSSEDLTEETGLSYKEQITARKRLVETGLLKETHKRLEHRIYFKLDLDLFNEMMEDGNSGKPPKVIPPNDQRGDGGGTDGGFVPTENTTETTPENKSSLAEKSADAFSLFWSAYPNKKAKGAAEKSWAKIKPDHALSELIIAAVLAQKLSEDWTKDGGKFIPHPATWLNAKRWEDEVTPATNQPTAKPKSSGPDFFDESWRTDTSDDL